MDQPERDDIEVRCPDVEVDLSTVLLQRQIRLRVQKALIAAGHEDEARSYLQATSEFKEDRPTLMDATRQWVTIRGSYIFDPGQRTPTQPYSTPPGNTLETGTRMPGMLAARVAAATPGAAARRAGAVARFVEVAMWIALGLIVIGGIIVAFQKEECSSGCSFAETHPTFGLGLGLAIGGAVQAAMVIMVAAYIQARADNSIK